MLQCWFCCAWWNGLRCHHVSQQMQHLDDIGWQSHIDYIWLLDIFSLPSGHQWDSLRRCHLCLHWPRAANRSTTIHRWSSSGKAPQLHNLHDANVANATSPLNSEIWRFWSNFKTFQDLQNHALLRFNQCFDYMYDIAFSMAPWQVSAEKTWRPLPWLCIDRILRLLSEHCSCWYR
jgi:hypothetical protein